MSVFYKQIVKYNNEPLLIFVEKRSILDLTRPTVGLLHLFQCCKKDVENNYDKKKNSYGISIQTYQGNKLIRETTSYLVTSFPSLTTGFILSIL